MQSSNSSFIGKQIGNYRIVSELASGAFGSVFQAQHTFLTERKAALKVLHMVHLGSDEERTRFIQEAQFLEKLKHPYILPVLDVGLYKNMPYLLIEYAPNGSLRSRLQKQGTRQVRTAQPAHYGGNEQTFITPHSSPLPPTMVAFPTPVRMSETPPPPPPPLQQRNTDPQPQRIITDIDRKTAQQWLNAGDSHFMLNATKRLLPLMSKQSNSTLMI